MKSLIPLDTTEGQAEARSGKLWDHLVDYHSKGYLLGCSTPSGHDAFWDENGLVKGHAYAILSVVTTNPPAGSTSGSKRAKTGCVHGSGEKDQIHSRSMRRLNGGGRKNS